MMMMVTMKTIMVMMMMKTIKAMMMMMMMMIMMIMVMMLMLLLLMMIMMMMVMMIMLMMMMKTVYYDFVYVFRSMNLSMIAEGQEVQSGKIDWLIDWFIDWLIGLMIDWSLTLRSITAASSPTHVFPGFLARLLQTKCSRLYVNVCANWS